MNWIVGIDPGINGAIAVVDEQQNLKLLCDLPTENYKANKRRLDAHTLCRLLQQVLIEAQEQNTTVRAYVEAVSARPGQGVVSMFNFGESQGVIRGVIVSLGLPYYTVSPARWKRYFGLDTGDKKSSLTRVRQQYPNAGLNLAKDVDKADAVHLALYGHHQHCASIQVAGGA